MFRPASRTPVGARARPSSIKSGTRRTMPSRSSAWLTEPTAAAASARAGKDSTWRPGSRESSEEGGRGQVERRPRDDDVVAAAHGVEQGGGVAVALQASIGKTKPVGLVT